jgi:hypothetical protein
VLNAINPDELIVRNNAAHGHFVLAGQFLGNSFASFSADATPAIVDALPTIELADRLQIELRLERRWIRPKSGADWRTFNWGREQAYAAVERYDAAQRARRAATASQPGVAATSESS